MTVSNSFIDNCEAETRIDHQVDDDDKRASRNSIRTIDGLDSSSSSNGGSSESSQSNDKSRKRSRSPSDDHRGKHLRGPITTEIHHLDMATTGRDNSLGTIVATIDSSVIALPIKIVQIIQTTATRINIETSLVISLITTIDNTTIRVCLTRILISKTVRDITPPETKT